MKPARYSLIRYIPDLARDEPINVGIVAWTETEVFVQVSSDALERVVHHAPHFASDAFQGYEDYLRAEVLREWPSCRHDLATSAEAHLRKCVRLPAVVTSSRFVGIEEGRATDEALGLACAELVHRLVRPSRKSSSHRSIGLVDSMKRELARLIDQKKIHAEYGFDNTRSGLRQTVDFYANSGTNVALDVLAIRSDAAIDSIMMRSSAEAAKIIDIRDKSQVSEFLVYAPIDQRPNLAPHVDIVRRALSISECRILESKDEALEVMRGSIKTLV